MLTIRTEQLDALERAAEEALAAQIAEHLRAEHAEVVVRLGSGARPVGELPERVLLSLVEAAVARARSYGIGWQSTLAEFAVLMVVAAPNFDEHPAVARVLRDENVAPDRRVGEVWERTSERDWEEIEEHYDPAAWPDDARAGSD